MKHFISSILLSATFAVTTFAQNTTEEEYNWMTKGYKNMVADGGDIKKGYYFDGERTDERTSYTFTYKLLRREKDKSIAGTLIVAYSKGSSNTYYYCLPALDFDGEQYTSSSYMSNLSDSVWDLDRAMSHNLFVSLAQYFSSLMTHYYKQ